MTAIGIAIVLERFLYLQSVTRTNRRTWDEFFPLLSKGELDKAKAVADGSNTYIGTIMSYGLARATVTEPRRVDDHPGGQATGQSTGPRA